LSSVLAPLFVFPTNSTVTNIVETFPFTVSCLATDLNTPPLPLTFALVSGPTNMTVAAGGLISWTPTPAQSPSANLVSVSVSNGALTTTNTFKIFVSPIPSITQVSVTATNVVLQWSAPTNDIFEVDWTTSLTPVVNWSPFTPPVTSTDGTFTFTDTNLPLLIKFYRLRLLP
jgi:hypothetical protein